MTIREKIGLLYAQIHEAENKIKDIRSECKHAHTKETQYSWRIGSILPAIVCVDCGELIKFILTTDP